MAWVESHQSLGQHPKTRKLARILNVPIPQAIGHLHMLWWWALDYAQDGDLSRYEDADIADAVLWEGSPALLMASLLDARFLDQPDGKPRIHDWDQYGGKLIARRKADAARKPRSGDPEDIHRNSGGSPVDIQRDPRVEESRGDKSRGDQIREESAPKRTRTPKEPKAPIAILTNQEKANLVGEYPEFDIQAELDNCRNIVGWDSKYVSEYGALRNRLRLRRQDRSNGNGRNHIVTPSKAAEIAGLAGYD